MLTAFLVAGVQTLSHRQLPSMAVMITPDSLSVAMSREIARVRHESEIYVGIRLEIGGAAFVTGLCEKGGVFRKVDSVRRAKVDIGCPSIHMLQ